jgi:hypothetical protein
MGCCQKFMGTSYFSLYVHWYVPRGKRVDVGVGYIVARIGSRLLHLDQEWEKFVVACTIFQNVVYWKGEADGRRMHRLLRL